MPMEYRFPRDESEDTIAQLAEKYPEVFLRRSKAAQTAKKNIIADLQKDGFGVAYEIITAAVEWYENHLGYQRAIQVGVKRIDLNGKDVGTVTELEHRAASKKIQEIHEKINAKKSFDATATNLSLHAAGRIPDDQLKKLDAPPMAPIKPRTITSTISDSGRSPDLAKVYSALEAANTALTGDADPDLRAALGTAALTILVKEANRIIAATSGGN